MKAINPAQLAFLLGIKKADAIDKMNYTIDNKGVKRTNSKDDKEPICDLKQLSEALGIDLEFYIKDIGKNFLKNQATGTYILNYPATKIKPNKKTGYFPKVVSIPTVLRSFLNKEVIEEIKKRWAEKYEKEMIEHEIIFR